MGFVLKIAIASAALAAAFVYGSEPGANVAPRPTGRVTLGEPARTDALPADIRRGVRVVPLPARQPV